MKTSKLALKAAGVAAAALLIACTPVVSQRGYLGDLATEGAIKPGTDTETTVQERLGYPSTTAAFGSDTWYYISSTEKQVAFFHPTVLRRQILAVYFDKDNRVTDLRHYTLNDGHVIAFESRETPARGRELTFLQQLLNATPGTQATPIQQVNPGNGGGPIP
ncbi:MAG: outer membrane protein assembly factor BamE [Alphaproteobacteria bacterium]|nr:outer membrane protein assembly factor BamE [Alphaproteobacteria bacterium]MBN9590343.1 outer membrane protein assembly factor BamE [Alphaproteobacteria bacterium]